MCKVKGCPRIACATLPCGSVHAALGMRIIIFAIHFDQEPRVRCLSSGSDLNADKLPCSRFSVSLLLRCFQTSALQLQGFLQ